MHLEAVATDHILSDTPEVDSGVKQAQVFVGRDTLFADVYPLKSGKLFPNMIEESIRRQDLSLKQGFLLNPNGSSRDQYP